MISSVCQGLQSHVLSFQLFPQDAHRKCEVEEKYSKHGENGNEEDKVYVHPPVKNSSTKLSKKSLEMCTERLGSESGSDMGEKEHEISLEADDSGPNVRCSTWMHKKLGNRRRRDTYRYPPPLTSISGRIRMESLREDGRLVLKAVASNSACRSSYFHAERSQGRLKLQLVEKRAKENENENGEVVEEEVLGDDEEEEEEGNSGKLEENGGEEIGMENFGRPRSSCSSRSCKQGGKELLGWKPRWVST